MPRTACGTAIEKSPEMKKEAMKKVASP